MAADKWRVTEIKGIFEFFGYEISSYLIQEALAKIQNEIKLEWMTGAQISIGEQIKSLLRYCGVYDYRAVEVVKVPYCYAALRAMPSACREVVEVLHVVRNRGLTPVITSNTGTTPGYVVRTILNYRGIEACFDSFFFSDELGVAKPNPAIFHQIAAQYGVSTSEIIHVGDTWETDVIGSQLAGSKSVWLSESKNCNDTVTIAELGQLTEIMDQLG